MTKKDIDCYRINYDKKEWIKKQWDLSHMEMTQYLGWVIVPTGILDAVAALCDEVERLKKNDRRKPRRSGEKGRKK